MSPTSSHARRAATGSPLASNGRAALAVLAVLVGCSFASGPILHLAQRAIGFHATPLQLRAWLLSPERIGRDGITRGQPVGFDVALPSSRPVRWTLRSDGVTIATGVVSGGAGTVAHRTVATASARPGAWLTIWFGSLATPLKVWVER